MDMVAVRRLELYPNGKKNSNGYGHISLYLAIADTDNLPLGWEVNANIIFFVFDQIRDKYHSIQDANGKVVKRFHKLKTEWGIDQLLSHDTLNNSLNGYLVDDTCVLGVEVYVIKGPFKGECLAMINEPQSDYFTWKIDKFMASKDKVYYSEQFTVEGTKWYDWHFANSASISVSITESLPPNRKMYIKYKLRMRDQINSNHLEKTDANGRVVRRFHKLKTEWGIDQLLFHDTFNDLSNGYLVDDICVFGVEIDNYTALKDKAYLSEQFTVRGRKWKLSLEPEEGGTGVGTYISLYLKLDDSESLPRKRKLYAKCNLRIRNQILGNHHEWTADYWFPKSGTGYGFRKFLAVGDLKDTSKGYLLDDALFIECKIDVIYIHSQDEMDASPSLVVASIDLNHANLQGTPGKELSFLTDMSLFHLNSNSQQVFRLDHTHTSFHILWDCPSSQDVWSVSGRKLQKRGTGGESFKEVVESMAELLQKEDLELFAMTAKGI
ncbi:uncharacterized protein LOC132190991 [Corylus avellana]|uniref:uncharacterized protein LOC132190991 n=1 Tax=Corylus avellana TaxID=13451 RepID=UPI00286C2F17|nr:uncharacterized protein LOC132190991 [Corylus avellana]